MSVQMMHGMHASDVEEDDFDDEEAPAADGGSENEDSDNEVAAGVKSDRGLKPGEEASESTTIPSGTYNGVDDDDDDDWYDDDDNIGEANGVGTGEGNSAVNDDEVEGSGMCRNADEDVEDNVGAADDGT